MKLHLPSLQAAATMARGTDKDQVHSMRLVQVSAATDGGQLVVATCNGHVAVRCHHPCRAVAPKGTYMKARPPVDATIPVEDTEIPAGQRLLLWGPSIPTRKPTKAERHVGSWVDLDALISDGAEIWWVKGDACEIKRWRGGELSLPTPNLTQILPAPNPRLLLAGSAFRVNADYLALACKASRLFTCGDDVDRVPAIEIFETSRIEGVGRVLIDLAPHYADDPVEPTSWAVVMPIQRRAGARGIQPADT